MTNTQPTTDTIDIRKEMKEMSSNQTAPKEYYPYKITCWNCGYSFTAQIGRGVSIDSYKRHNDCSNCGCSLVRQEFQL